MPLDPVRWGRLSDHTRERIPCLAVGFPDATHRAGVRDTKEMRGHIEPLTGLKSGLITVHVDLSAAPSKPSANSRWAGSSGAALFCGPFLVGVVTTDRAAEYQANQLTVVAISTLAERSGFRQTLTAHGTSLTLVQATASRSVIDISLSHRALSRKAKWLMDGSRAGLSALVTAWHERSRAMVTAAIAITMVLGSLFVLINNDSGGKPPKTQQYPVALRQKWKMRLPSSDQRSSLSISPTIWSQPYVRNPVYADSNGVRGFDRETGKMLWTVKTPRGASEICAVSSGPSGDGVGAAVFDAGGNNCAYLVVFDTDTGQTLWSKNLAGNDGTEAPRLWTRKLSGVDGTPPPQVDPQVVVNSQAVVTDIGDRLSAYAITGGRKLWTLQASGPDCWYDVAASDYYLAISRSCDDGEDQLTIYASDGDTWRFSKEKRDVEQVVSGSPLMLVFEEGENNRRSLQTYTEDGKPDKTFPLTGKLGKLQFEGNRTLVDESIMVSSYGSSTIFGPDGIVATDLKTGKVLWSKREGWVPVSIEEHGQVTAIMPPRNPWAGDPKVVSISLRDGKERVRGTLYTPEHSLYGASYGGWSDEVYAVGEKDPGDSQAGRMLRAFGPPY